MADGGVLVDGVEAVHLIAYGYRKDVGIAHDFKFHALDGF